MRRRICFFAVAFFVCQLATAQSDCRYTLRGNVREAATKEPIPFATVLVRELGTGATTDENGNFSIPNLCRQAYTLELSHVECRHLTQNVVVDGDTEGSFFLQHDDKILQKIEVKDRRVVRAETSANAQISGVALDQTRGQTLGDALSKLSGVSLLTTGATIAKPTIQGLHSDRVLIINNGVRQESQSWGLDHAPEIDPFLADKLTVVKGSSAVRYGVGAIGGVILVEPRALRDTLGLGGEVNFGAWSNGRGGVVSAILDGKNARFSWRIQGTAKRSGDVSTPQYNLQNTGVEELNGSVMLGFGRKGVKTEIFFSHFYSKIGILKSSHIGNLTDLQNAIERGRPQTDAAFSYDIARPAQRISHDILKIKSVVPTAESGRLTWQVAAQYDLREEYDAHRPGGSVPVGFEKAEIAFELPSVSARAEWEHRPFKNWHGGFGTEGAFQLNNTFAGGLIPNYRQTTVGAFWTERWRRFPAPFEVELGVRYDFRRLSVDSTRYGDQNHLFDFGNISSSVGGIFHLKNWGKIAANVGTAWRSPNVNELFSNGVHHGTASFEHGDPNLISERALSATLSFEVKTVHFQSELNIYQNQIANFIFLEPADKPVLTVRGAFPAFNYRQTDALLRGLDANFRAHVVGGLWWHGAFSTLFARDIRRVEWLPLMPTDRLEQGLKLEISKMGVFQNPYFDVNIVGVAKQNRVPLNTSATGETTIRDYAAAPNSYIRVDASAGADARIFGKSARFSVQMSNVFDVQYRDYLDRFRYFTDAVGRNFRLNFKINF